MPTTASPRGPSPETPGHTWTTANDSRRDRRIGMRWPREARARAAVEVGLPAARSYWLVHGQLCTGHGASPSRAGPGAGDRRPVDMERRTPRGQTPPEHRCDGPPTVGPITSARARWAALRLTSIKGSRDRLCLVVARRSSSRVSPAPSSQTSLARPMPSGVGRRLPSGPTAGSTTAVRTSGECAVVTSAGRCSEMSKEAAVSVRLRVRRCCPTPGGDRQGKTGAGSSGDARRFSFRPSCASGASA